MSYCKECGAKLESNSKFCQNCGNKIQQEIKTDDNVSSGEISNNNTTTTSKLKCPKCNSTNVTSQVVTENETTGCFMILLCIILAITLVGIPIMIIILLARGQKTSSKTVYVCQNCGNTFSEN